MKINKEYKVELIAYLRAQMASDQSVIKTIEDDPLCGRYTDDKDEEVTIERNKNTVAYLRDRIEKKQTWLNYLERVDP